MTEGRCWRQATGDGPVVVLVHGTMDRATSFNRVQRLLLEDHRVVRYDRRGYARSLALGPPASFSQQVGDLLDVVADATGEGPAPVIFGHSYGGTIALGAAHAAPERIAGVVAYEAPLPWMDWWPAGSAGAAAVASADDPEEVGERFMRRMVGDRRWERLPPSTRADRRAEGATLVAEIAQLRPPNDVPVDLAAITVALTAAHGTEGAPHHAQAARALAEAVPGAVLEVVDDTGHGIHLTNAPAVASLVRDLEARLA